MPIFNTYVQGPVEGLGAFGSVGGFKERQAIRDQYLAVVRGVQGLVPQLPSDMQVIVNLYLNHVASVIARGATISDVQEIEGKLAQWEAVYLSRIAAEQAATERVAAEYAVEAATERERVKRLAAERAAEARAATARAAEARAATERAAEARAAAAAAAEPPVTYPAVTTPSILPSAESLKAGLMDNPVLIAVAVGALIFLLKK